MQTSHHRLHLPEGMRTKLEAFRRRLWMIKIAEGVLAAAFGLLVSYLLVFLLDRFADTPTWLRVLILGSGTIGLGVALPLKWHRWVWRTRQLEQVARVLRHKFPRLGDRLLGIVELAHSELEQERSETLCRAAMRQVDEATRQRDFTHAVPNPRHWRWACAAGVPLVIAAIALTVVPAAASNALARWLMPWKYTQRYTFAQLQNLPESMIVPYAEPFAVTAQLSERTAWSPRQASARYGKQAPVRAGLSDRGYTFEMPPQRDSEPLTVSVGDAREKIQVQPTTRPELTSMMARVELPDYLHYSTDLTKDVRGGAVSLVSGSRVTFEATATRELAEATMNGAPQAIEGNKVRTSAWAVHDSTTGQVTWRDCLGLSAKEPFVVTIHALDDESPTISCNQLSREQVVLDEDVLSFRVAAQDDFGVQQIGMEWVGIEDPLRNPHPARGEKIVSAGAPEQRELEVTSTFSAKREGVKPQSLQLRLFTVDYLPGRERVYSPTYVLHVLSPEEHAIWLTHQLRKWFRQAQGVYEREQQLHQINKELRRLSPEEIDQPDNRHRIETQAAAEQTNARRLSALTAAGGQLIQQATRNDQFNVATLENWAQMLQTLKEIADNRMPSVAELLQQAANAPGSTAQAKPSPSQPNSNQTLSPPQVGNNRDARSGGGKPPQSGEPTKAPSIVDVESGFNELDDDTGQQEEPSQSGAGRLTLPTTVVKGGGAPQENQDQSRPAQQKVEEAVEEQEDLLAEFAKVAEELQKILDNLEGSTFVKRLKAASRRQLEVAGDLNQSLLGSFGLRETDVQADLREQSQKIAEREVAQSDSVYIIQEDLAAYYNRVQQGKFKTVLNEMESERVVHGLRDLADTVQNNLSGQSIAHAEFWADTLDRWAEQLVGPG